MEPKFIRFVNEGAPWVLVFFFISCVAIFRCLSIPLFLLFVASIAAWFMQFGSSRVQVGSGIGIVIIFIATCIYTRQQQPETYEGTVSAVVRTRGGLDIDLDGLYPHEKMIAFVPNDSLRDGVWTGPYPVVGDSLRVFGKVTDYRGHHEIVITSSYQIDP